MDELMVKKKAIEGINAELDKQVKERLKEWLNL